MTASDRQNAFSGTKEVAERLRFDAGRLEAYLRDQCRASPARSWSASSRAASRTRLISSKTPLRRYVLRRKPPGKLLPSAHAVDREYRVISALHAQGFPVAEPLALLRRR